MLKDIRLEQMAGPLLEWFSGNARKLPWRDDPSPYRVWVSEIMLQQTRVEAVRPYFERFLRKLPDVWALAACPEDELLKLWEGLGYYNRVRNMQKAAQEMTEKYGGCLPADEKALLGLKGIGRYTAGAVASIAYGLPAPAVDGNVLRVLTRVAADPTDIKKQSFKEEVEDAVRAMLMHPDVSEKQKESLRDGNVSGAVNQALMELGATVCVPNGTPGCGECPWSVFCIAAREGRTGDFPVKSRPKARKVEERTVLVIRSGDKVAIRRRPKKGLLAGLYEFPNVEGVLSRDEVLALVKKMRLSPTHIWELDNAKHIFSHIEWHMQGYAVRVPEQKGGEGEEPELIFVDVKDAKERYAIPSAFAAYTGYLAEWTV